MSADGETFEIDSELVKFSGLISNMLNDLAVDENEDVLVPLGGGVQSDTLRSILEWAEHHKDDHLATVAKVEDNKTNPNGAISEWDQSFLKVSQKKLFEIITAANYLDAKALLDTACKTVAAMIKGKGTDEIRKHFHIKNDLNEPDENDAATANAMEN